MARFTAAASCVLWRFVPAVEPRCARSDGRVPGRAQMGGKGAGVRSEGLGSGRANVEKGRACSSILGSASHAGEATMVIKRRALGKNENALGSAAFARACMSEERTKDMAPVRRGWVFQAHVSAPAADSARRAYRVCGWGFASGRIGGALQTWWFATVRGGGFGSLDATAPGTG